MGPLCNHPERVEGCVRCHRWHTDEPGYRKAVESVRTGHKGPAVERKLPVGFGPGTELKALLSSLGIGGDKCCGCAMFANAMDEWGVEGCRKKMNAILAHVGKQAKATSWQKWLKAIAIGTASSLAFRVNPLDPVRGIVNEAIRRAEANGQRSDLVH